PDAKVRELSFTYHGTPLKVRVPVDVSLRLTGTSENAVADGWNRLSSDEFAPLVADCMKLKSGKKLCDWAYLNMLKAMADAYAGAGSNESTLITAFLFSQSGYRIRLASDGSHLELLYASQHSIYDKPYFTLDGEKFYPMSKNVGSNLRICSAKFPKEKSLSLWVQNNPEVAESASQARTVTSKRYPDFSFRVSVNKNLIAFYDTYPTSEVGGNFMTRWAMYANTPVCASVRNELYPAIKSKTAGMSQLEAAERILNWIQTGMVYEYDDKVWGHDRAFFANESLYYPYCDCEDRSILFTRIMRDLYGLKCILIYYPGHLACAVNFPGGAKGDYIMVNGQKYTVCDPTYIGAPVGMTMDGMDNATAKVITLD
ncbi:MAG: hypothetical protein K2M76_06265, partial [Muribaculaceae bacterium]|nr:hypothetical protein [Muribaculaceae bacterium]